jgi:5-(carboxyamino)imidazole ribonucleotide synthase
MSPTSALLLPGATLGVLGGGQLGRMFVHQAQAMGYFTAVLDPDPTSPAGLVSHHHIQTGYEDPQGLARAGPRAPRSPPSSRTCPPPPGHAGRAPPVSPAAVRGGGAGPRAGEGPLSWPAACPARPMP